MTENGSRSVWRTTGCPRGEEVGGVVVAGPSGSGSGQDQVVVTVEVPEIPVVVYVMGRVGGVMDGVPITVQKPLLRRDQVRH